MWDDILRERVRREVDMYMTAAALVPQKMAEKVMAASTELRTSHRSGYRAISRKAIEGLVHGTRATRLEALQGLKRFVAHQRRLPTFLFDVDPVVVDLAKQQMSFFKVRHAGSWISKFAGMYRIDRPGQLFGCDLIVDYSEQDNVLLVRGRFLRRQPEKQDDTKKWTGNEDLTDTYAIAEKIGPLVKTYVSGYAVAAKNVLIFFLTDHQTPNAYVIQLPRCGEDDDSRSLRHLTTPPQFGQKVKYMLPEDRFPREDTPLDVFKGWPLRNKGAQTIVSFTPDGYFGPPDMSAPPENKYYDIFGTGKIMETWAYRNDVRVLRALAIAERDRKMIALRLSEK